MSEQPPGECPLHPKPVHPPKEEVVGLTAEFTIQNTYEGTYPDRCEAPRSYRYSLYVDDQYIASAENTNTALFRTLKSIAERLNRVEGIE